MKFTTQIRLQKDPYFWLTVEDTDIDVGDDGCTVSYWEFQKPGGDKRVKYITIDEDSALALADSIYKLFKKQ